MAGKTLVIPNAPSNKNNMHQLKYARTRLREHSPHLQSVPSSGGGGHISPGFSLTHMSRKADDSW